MDDHAKLLERGITMWTDIAWVVGSVVVVALAFVECIIYAFHNRTDSELTEEDLEIIRGLD